MVIIKRYSHQRIINIPFKVSMKNIFLNTCCDFICIVLAHLPYLYLKHNLQPYKQGFFCDDQSLMYPYKDSTVTSLMLTSINLAIPIFMTILLEYFLSNSIKIDHKDASTIWKNPLLRTVPKILCIFLIGYGMNESTTELLKAIIGRLRPHFFTVCAPDIGKSCLHQYFNGSTKCVGANLSRIKDARKSFPSGHASSSMYSMAFTAFYIHFRAKLPQQQSLKVLSELIFISVSLYISATRISDFKHHWGDVLGGILIGATFGVISANCALHFIDSYFDGKVRNGESRTNHRKSSRNPKSKDNYSLI